MEIILDELKQYDLKKINYSELKLHNYYLGYNYQKSIEFFYCHANYFDNGEINLLWQDEYDEIYEFQYVNTKMKKYSIISDTFYYVCNNLKNNEQSIENFNKLKNKYICMDLFYNWRKKTKNIKIYYSNNICYDNFIKIIKFKNLTEFNKKNKIFINEIEKKNIFFNKIKFYYQ